jgi:hypothetical protein
MGILLRHMKTTVFNVVEKRSEGTPKGKWVIANVR